MDLITVGSTGVRSKLIADAEIFAYVEKLDGQAKIFLEAAEGQSDGPYVVIHHIWGGDLNNAPSQEFDMLFRIDAIAKKLPQARHLSGLIRSALHRQTLTYLDGWTDWATATCNGNYLEQQTVQGVQYWATGPFVRLRGTKPA